MKILALDCSTELCSVALFINGEIYQYQNLNIREHNHIILSLIQKLLAQAELSLYHLDGLAFGQGPGSFTGIRLACSVIQGLALATDLPVVGLSSLLILAQSAYRQFSAQNVLPCLDARMQKVYFAACSLGQNQLMEFIQEEEVIAPSHIKLDFPTNYYAVGNGWKAQEELMQRALSHSQITLKIDCFPEAKDLALLAAPLFMEGKVLKENEILPVYLQTPTYVKS